MSAKKEDPRNHPGAVTHIRRCHVCGTVNESEDSGIIKCNACGKHFAPFYFFDENTLVGISDTQFYASVFNQTEDTRPIYGLSTYWE